MPLTNDELEQAYLYLMQKGQSLAALKDGGDDLTRMFLAPVLQYNQGGTSAELVRVAISLLQGEDAFETWRKNTGNDSATFDDFMDEIKGKQGDPFLYENFTPEQLDGLRLTWEKLTDEQKEFLKLRFEHLSKEDIKVLQQPAIDAISRLNNLSEHRDEIRDGYWWRWNEETEDWYNTGEIAQGKAVKVLENGNYAYWNEVTQQYEDSGVEASASVDIENVEVVFQEAEIRENINTGEKFPILFGKIKKWFSDLKALAFKDKADWNTDIDNRPTSMPASDVQAWAKADKKPTYTADEVGASSSNHNHDDIYQAIEEGKGLSTNDYTDDEKVEVSKVKDKADKAQFKSFTLLSANWVDDTATSGFFTYQITDKDITSHVVVDLDAVTDEDYSKLEEFEFSGRLIVSVGQFLIRAKKQPTSDINVVYAIKF